MGTSPTPDTEGSRNVTSAYVEWQVPLVLPEQEIPLMQALNTQIAARYERFSDIEDDVLKPKVAIAWEVTDWLHLRAGYAEGFRAPNLEQINATEIRRAEENLTDLYLCALNQGCHVYRGGESECVRRLSLQRRRHSSRRRQAEAGGQRDRSAMALRWSRSIDSR